MAVLFTDRRGPVVNVEASAAEALAKALAADTGKPVKVYRRTGAGIDWLVTSEPDPGSGWSCVFDAPAPS